MAVPTHVAAALSGATYNQLVYWRSSRGGAASLLVPEYRHGRTWLYSFRDVVALRTFAYLREDVSLQKIREAVRTLGDLGDAEHLSEYRLYAADGSVVWVPPDGDHVDLVARRGQLRAGVVMRDVFGAFENRGGRKVLPLLRPYRHITVDPQLRGGFPVVRDTRIPYDLVASLVRAGTRSNQVRELYPAVSPAGARDAARMADYVDRARGRQAA